MTQFFWILVETELSRLNGWTVFNFEFNTWSLLFVCFYLRKSCVFNGENNFNNSKAECLKKSRERKEKKKAVFRQFAMDIK